MTEQPQHQSTICHICKEPRDAPGKPWCSAGHPRQETTPRTVLIVPARAFGKSAALALAARGDLVIDARNLPPAPPRPRHDGITSIPENEADL